MFVNEQFIAYVASFTGMTKDDPEFNPVLDHNEDGLINITDISWFATQVGKWVELEAMPKSFMDWWASRPKFLAGGFGGFPRTEESE